MTGNDNASAYWLSIKCNTCGAAAFWFDVRSILTIERALSGVDSDRSYAPLPMEVSCDDGHDVGACRGEAPGRPSRMALLCSKNGRWEDTPEHQAVDVVAMAHDVARRWEDFSRGGSPFVDSRVKFEPKALS